MKKILRSIFNSLGYDFIKINVHSADKSSKTFPVKVGDFEIMMPGNNPQISLYKYSPTSNNQLGRLAKLVKSKYADSSMIDVGANVGDTIAVVKSHTNIPVIAIEGDPISFSFLKQNSARFQDVYILSQYLGEEKKELSVNIEKDGWNNTIIPSTGGSKKLDIKTLDEVIVEHKLEDRKIKLLKVDTEGFDTIILRGARNTILKNKPVLYFEFNGQNMNAIKEDGLGTLLSFKDAGYSYVHIYDCIDNLIMVTTLDNTDALQQLNDYAHKERSMIPYYDICVFHSDDNDLAERFHQSER